MRGDEFYTAIARRPPFTKLHPRVAGFFKDYFAKEKAIPFGEQFVVNTHFPPYPSRAFDHLAAHFAQLGDAATRRLYSVTLAITNRCPFNCWHCYNAGRSPSDMPLALVLQLATELQSLGAVMVTLTGGEPLLRADLPDIVRAFDRRSCLILGTTGEGLTSAVAQDLRASGLFAVGISLDSDAEAEHDRSRGRPGAFRSALQALRTARENGLYPYVVSVATHGFLQRKRFLPFLNFAAAAGALEVHLLEPCASGRLAGRTDVLLTAAERQQIIDYQSEVAEDSALPILSSFTYLESPDAFGCGAGLTHLYIDGSGEVCPCNLVPLSFGNLTREPLQRILDRMGQQFCRPRTGCVGKILARHYPATGLPLSPEFSAALCERHLPRDHALPRFFQVRDETKNADVGAFELQEAYDRVQGDYDAFWLVAAAEPVDRLVASLPWRGTERVFEAGCGTGYATALLASHAAEVFAVDLSAGMLQQAQRRLAARSRQNNVHFQIGDALAALRDSGPFDCVFSSWVLGYIPLAPFFAEAQRALAEGGRLAFIVHKENSPREPLELFAELVAEDPTVLQKRVAFDFPPNANHLCTLLQTAGFKVGLLWEDTVTFRYGTAREVLDHLLKSGAGTAFYDAIDPTCRPALTDRFLLELTRRCGTSPGFAVHHDYLGCVAARE